MSTADEFTTVKELIEFLQKLPPDAVVLYAPLEVLNPYPGYPTAFPENGACFSYEDCLEDCGLHLIGEQSVGIDHIDDLSEEGRKRIKYVGIA